MPAIPIECEICGEAVKTVPTRYSRVIGEVMHFFCSTHCEELYVKRNVSRGTFSGNMLGN
ncbi:hypothetical protein HY633_02960 [Candidatus Uhrbacteria bacterium]|nr:hypothetical protein [Candidatus Uhrbacteria bacterium]